MPRIPVSAAKDIAKKYNLEGVIIIGIDNDSVAQRRTQLATYGKNKVKCKQYGSVGEQLVKLILDGSVQPK